MSIQYWISLVDAYSVRVQQHFPILELAREGPHQISDYQHFIFKQQCLIEIGVRKMLT